MNKLTRWAFRTSLMGIGQWQKGYDTEAEAYKAAFGLVGNNEKIETIAYLSIV